MMPAPHRCSRNSGWSILVAVTAPLVISACGGSDVGGADRRRRRRGCNWRHERHGWQRRQHDSGRQCRPAGHRWFHRMSALRGAAGCFATGPCGCGHTCPDAGQAPGSCGGAQCGPGTSCCGPPECGRCVPDTSGVFCPEYCDSCGGNYQRYSNTTFCSGARGVTWLITTGDPAPFAVPECQDAATNLIRFCCTPGFTPVCR